MKIKTSELRGPALDWAVALAEGATRIWFDTIATYWVEIDDMSFALNGKWAESMMFNPSTNWAQGGPIIERERLEFSILTDKEGFIMAIGVSSDGNSIVSAEGPTYLIAAVRCYVASRLGDEVDVPEDLL